MAAGRRVCPLPSACWGSCCSAPRRCRPFPEWTMPLIALEGVRSRPPEADRQALDGITAAVEPGEVILLRGPSGSGKSTLLRCLNSLVPHSTGGDFAGRVTVCGLDTRMHLPRDLGARIGFVFQHPDAQFVLEDVEAELAFGLENLGLDRTVMRKRIEETIDQVGINALRHRRIATLSGGERQRVAIAAALATHPAALVLDEPTSQLDPQAAEDVLQVVLRLVADLGMTTVIAEHRVERIAPFVDRIWTLDAGRMPDQAPRMAVADGGARPPVVDLALRAGWSPIPLGLRDARLWAQSLPAAIPDRPLADGAGTVVARLERLGYAYPGARAVDNVSLTLRRSQVTALMGRNGSGKTTLLKLVAGTLRPQGGQLHSQGRVAYVPQDADALLFAATVQDELRGQAEDVIAPFQPWLSRYPRDLSAGERQQLAIAVVAGGAPPPLSLSPPPRPRPRGGKRARTFFRVSRAPRSAALLARPSG